MSRRARWEEPCGVAARRRLQDVRNGKAKGDPDYVSDRMTLGRAMLRSVMPACCHASYFDDLAAQRPMRMPEACMDD
jgi:hypothetical protein